MNELDRRRRKGIKYDAAYLRFHIKGRIQHGGENPKHVTVVGIEEIS